MFCVKCGVELADSEERCPLCGTKVYNPEIERVVTSAPYPEFTAKDSRMSKRGIMLIVTILFCALITQLLICELSIPRTKGWAGYAVYGVALFYVLVALPMWFRKPNPVIFVPCDFAAILAYLFYINYVTKGGWFLSFALPAVGVLALITSAAVTLFKYLHHGYLYVCGGVLIANGFYTVLLEYLISSAFDVRSSFHWSLFPLIGCFIIGMGFIIISICKPIKEALKKKLFF